MANPEHLKIIKKGVEAWTEWREQNLQAKADLSKANFFGDEVRVVDLRGANLRQANLRDAAFHGANLREANLGEANLRGAQMLDTVLGELDLRGVKGLESVVHSGPSTVGIDTIYQSKGEIPEVFLRGAGVPEDFIVYMKSLVVTPLDFNSCFISYSSLDREFAEQLYAALQDSRIRCWYAPENLKIGDEFREKIDNAIRLHDKLLIVLSESSIQSPWVKSEVEAAFETEHKQKRTVLFPIRLDDAVMETDKAWAADIRRTRHIGDLSNWKNLGAFQKAFERLLRDLKAEKPEANKK